MAESKKVMLLYICSSLILFMVVLFPVVSQGKVMDGIACNSCHTMHNSQDGASMTTASTEGLLNSSCAGCHSGTNINPSVSGFPYVFDPSGAPTYGATGTSGHDTLAGGNFYWVATSSDRKGHNVVGIAADDALFGPSAGAGQLDIPGSNPAIKLPSQLTCAGGVWSCHGKRNAGSNAVEALMPAHHVTDDPTLGTSVANSLRFLSGVIGVEDADWEFTVSQTDHNQYKGTTGAATDTITTLCASCHGDFHASGVTPFLRHPTDVSMPGTGEYASYITYKPETPVASDPAAAVLENVSAAGNRIISCISCHRAHGTPFDAILRWDYKSWPGSGYDGCGQCHSTKN